LSAFFLSLEVKGELNRIVSGMNYKISNSDLIQPFLMAFTIDSDIYMFISNIITEKGTVFKKNLNGFCAFVLMITDQRSTLNHIEKYFCFGVEIMCGNKK